MKLLTVSPTKTRKGEKKGYLTGILYLAPHTTAGVGNLCPMATGCADACLYTSGLGEQESVRAGRIRKTRLLMNSRDEFMWQLSSDIEALKRAADRQGLIPCVRPNGTADFRWETVPFEGASSIIAYHDDIQWYDYTKLGNRKVKHLDNYHLTYSWAELPRNRRYANDALQKGLNVARVFRNKNRPGVYSTRWDFPETFLDRPLVDGDLDDLRFLDPPPTKKGGNWIGLRAKRYAVTDNSKFVTAIKPLLA